MSEITTRPAQSTQEDCEAIFRLLLNMYQEVARHPINPNKAFAEVWTCVDHAAAYLVFRDGEPVATSGFQLLTPWFSDEKFFSDQWFYIRKDCRDDSRILKALLGEARELANSTGAAVQFKFYDPNRPNKSKIAVVAEDFFFQPVGKLRRAEPNVSKE